ncbi:hypothetical protein GX48_03228 [Paracoccidioides brasiliensis]|nr:hypothetical protein GX48_03228 [Paracoccidioides brasiliensis]
MLGRFSSCRANNLPRQLCLLPQSDTTSPSHHYLTFLGKSFASTLILHLLPQQVEVVLSYEGHRERESTHPVDRCILHPPLPGLTGKGTIRLKVDGPVRTGDQHSAQLVTVHMVDKAPEISDSIPTDKYLVAKLYDPLYFDHEQDDVDPFRYTDLAYSHETAAYRLLYPLEGTVIPKYYGSFTLELPILNKKNFAIYPVNPYRKSTRDLNATSQSNQPYAAIVDAESMLYAHDILHRDIHPRNVLVLDSAHRCVVLIDFGYCGIGRTPSNSPAEWKAKYLPGVPISPIAALGSGLGPSCEFS